MIGTTVGLVGFIISLPLGPEIVGKEMVSDLDSEWSAPPLPQSRVVAACLSRVT
ncbi:MAG TPA: hypothetical protein VKI44_19745 [Acetobacteraceae bacterium]|nr:hypothetical protein [Acetobacteraceae bacterium]